MEEVTTFAREVEKYPRENFNAALNAKVGVPMAKGLVAFANQDYEAALKFLRPIRHDILSSMGGSHAQKDIIGQVKPGPCLVFVYIFYVCLHI